MLQQSRVNLMAISQMSDLKANFVLHALGRHSAIRIVESEQPRPHWSQDPLLGARYRFLL